MMISLKSFNEQVTYQRAFDVAIGSMLAMTKYGMHRAY